MPYSKRKQSCTQSSGKKGKYTLSYVDKKGKKHRSCHTSKEKAQAAIAAIERGKHECDGVREGEGCSCGVKVESISWNLGHRGDFFGNPYTRNQALGDEAPEDEFEIDPDDPIGLVRAAVKAEIERQIRGN